jgi:hypothetical protein
LKVHEGFFGHSDMAITCVRKVFARGSVNMDTQLSSPTITSVRVFSFLRESLSGKSRN